MGRRVMAGGILLLGAALGAAALQSATGLVGHWELDDAAAPAVDAVGAAGNGTWTGAPSPVTTVPAAVASFSTHSLSFDGTGTDDYVQLPNTPALEAVQENDFTLMAWYRPASVPANTMSTTTHDDAAHGILIKAGWHCGLYYNHEQKFVFEHWLDTGTPFQPAWMGTGTWTTTYPANGSWYHVAGVFDRTAGQTRIYVNGALVWTTTWTAGTPSYPAGTAAHDYGTTPWRIGIANPGGDYTFPAHGMIDDARIYNRELADAEILAIYQGTDLGAATPTVVTPPPPPPPPPAPRTAGDNAEGLLEDKCACGSTASGPSAVWAAAAAALLLLALRMK